MEKIESLQNLRGWGRSPWISVAAERTGLNIPIVAARLLNLYGMTEVRTEVLDALHEILAARERYPREIDYPGSHYFGLRAEKIVDRLGLSQQENILLYFAFTEIMAQLFENKH